MTDTTSAAPSLTRDEWKRRYAARIKEQTGLDADDLAETAASAEEDAARYAGKGPVVWEDPEWAADEELSYWGDDDGE